MFRPAPAPAGLAALSLHDALPILRRLSSTWSSAALDTVSSCRMRSITSVANSSGRRVRSEEHTSELQSRFELVCRLLLEKKRLGRLSRAARYKYPYTSCQRPCRSV